MFHWIMDNVPSIVNDYKSLLPSTLQRQTTQEDARLVIDTKELNSPQYCLKDRRPENTDACVKAAKLLQSQIRELM